MSSNRGKSVALILFFAFAGACAAYTGDNGIDGANISILKKSAVGVSKLWSTSPKQPKSYEIIEIEMPWLNALTFCKERRGNLATIRSEEEMGQIADHVKLTYAPDGQPGDGWFWIGGTKIGSSRRFYWMTDGSPPSFSGWSPGWPKDSRSECMQLQHKDGTWGWINVDCNIVRWAICEYS